MKKEKVKKIKNSKEKEPFFELDTCIPKKGGWKYFLFNFLKSLSILLIIFGIVLLAIYFVLKTFKDTLKMTEVPSLLLILGIVLTILGIVSLITSLILLNFYKSSVKKAYKNFFEEHKQATSFQNDYQSFYNIENNLIKIYQNFDLVIEINPKAISKIEKGVDLSKFKEYKREIVKRKIGKFPTLLGFIIHYNENKTFTIAINLSLTNYSLETTYNKKIISQNYNFAIASFDKLERDINLLTKHSSNKEEQKLETKENNNLTETNKNSIESIDKKQKQVIITNSQENRNDELIKKKEQIKITKIVKNPNKDNPNIEKETVSNKIDIDNQQINKKWYDNHILERSKH